MDNRKRAAEAVNILKKVYPDAACALEWAEMRAGACWLWVDFLHNAPMRG